MTAEAIAWQFIKNEIGQGRFQIIYTVGEKEPRATDVAVLERNQSPASYLTDSTKLGSMVAVARCGERGMAEFLVNSSLLEVTAITIFNEHFPTTLEPEVKPRSIPPQKFYFIHLVDSVGNSISSAEAVIKGYPKEGDEVIETEPITITIKFIPSGCK